MPAPVSEGATALKLENEIQEETVNEDVPEPVTEDPEKESPPQIFVPEIEELAEFEEERETEERTNGKTGK